MSKGEAYVAAILAARMEEQTMDAAPVWSNVKTFDPKPWRGCVDIITAGYPCQPFSIAGAKRAEKDPRHLWPYIREIVRTIEPGICFFENVSHHLRLGFEQVHDDLRAMGYSVAAGLFTAEEVGAPHKRERLFILAYRESDRSDGGMSKLSEIQRTAGCGNAFEPSGSSETYVADGNSNGFLCEQGAPTRENDPQGWTECSADSFAGGNGDATGGLPLHETGSSSPKSGQGLQNSKSALANTKGARAGIDQCNARERSGGDSAELANTPRNRKRRETGKLPEAHERQDGQGAQLAHGTNQSMANSAQPGLERHTEHETQKDGASLSFGDSLQLWPPSPGDTKSWGSVPDALKPAIHRMADGMAYRVDRVRACGNGVVPLVAAYAFRTLLTAIDQ